MGISDYCYSLQVPMRFFTAVFISMLCGFSSISAQRTHAVDVVANVGLPELTGLGMRYYQDGWRGCLDVGYLPTNKGLETNFSLTIGAQYHFGGVSRVMTEKPWYFGLDWSFLRYENTWEIERYTYLNPRMGRYNHISPRWYVSIDGGFLLELSHVEIEKRPRTQWLSIDFPLLPSFSVSLGYTIWQKIQPAALKLTGVLPSRPADPRRA